MSISKKLNRDFYIKMRLNGVSHETITKSIFPKDRVTDFNEHIQDLVEIDYTKKVNIEKLVEGVKPKKN